ncbi:LacI family DNA-binding transcriptional regulator [Anaerotalea alkaliphila]|uniref:LacI family transcriptional regulator n=1 Tax=Anaerotalea alkaliphila TaxID=2662126 RepID=A0A7X5HW90_9FIRM|nr:LacI family DNA-binding transcriptional regulator [Anaerotalea alkaliphila]NDL67805.1 LacI family transcriptional regulator [Anaerotalea alkaliphila]
MTIKEIAEQTGFSLSTVSLVLNNKPGVREETRNRIARLLVENGYTLRTESQGPEQKGELTLLRYKAVGHKRERNEDFFVGLLNGAEPKARQLGYSLGLVQVDDGDLVQVLERLEAQDHVAGVLFLGTEFDTRRHPLLEGFSKPLVCLDNRFENLPVNTVCADSLEGIHQALSHLKALGHREVGYLRGSVPIGGLADRQAGFSRAVEDLGLSLCPEHVVEVDLLFDAATQQMLAHLDRKPSLPTAFFADNDIIAAGCQRALQQRGYRVPEDVALVGFDDGSMSTVLTPALTTMRSDKPRLGEMAVERLVDMAENGRRDVVKSFLGVTLVKRGTT